MLICAGCHDDYYQQVIRSGHPYKLTQTNGIAPVVPYDLGDFDMAPTYPDNPPDGYAWSDVSYIIGGWGWKLRFIDNDGYVITSGAAGTEVQFNLHGEGDQEWTTYHTQDEPGTKPYNCGRCHTTGYSPEGNQDGMEGMIGTWSEPGITCEGCHGPGGAHAAAPEEVMIYVDRDSQLCGSCHVRGGIGSIPASLKFDEGDEIIHGTSFTRHHEQFNEHFNSQHAALDCVTCHDPHLSVAYTDETYNPNGGIIRECESCHFDEATYQASSYMRDNLECADCHMPWLSKSALAHPTLDYIGDVRSHSFAINTDVDAPQFYLADPDDITSSPYTYPYITLDYACRHCHQAGADSVLTDEQLEAEAFGYHDRVR